MESAEAIAEYADDGGLAVHLPANLADRQARQRDPRGEPDRTPEVVGGDRRGVLRHVEEVLGAREYRVLMQAERSSGRDPDDHALRGLLACIPLPIRRRLLPAGPIHHETAPHPLRWHLLIAGVRHGWCWQDHHGSRR